MPRTPPEARRLTPVLARPAGVRLASLVLDLLLVVLLVAVFLFGVFWFPLLLLAVAVGLSLWLVRRYYLDDLDELEERRARS
jgi:membrane protein implicated in regulation of membrane protease activity